MSLLVAIRVPMPELGKGVQFQSAGMRRGEGRRRLQLEMALDKLAEFFAVFIAHVHEFDAAAVGADVADYGGEIDLSEAGAHLELDRIADREPSRGLQIGAAKSDRFYARKARGCALDLRTEGRVQRNSSVASRDNVAGTRLRRRAKGGCCLLE